MPNASEALQHSCDCLTVFAEARRVKRAARPGSRGWRWIAWAPNDESPPEPIATRKYSGEFKLRVPPPLHRALVMEAAENNVSLNRLVNAKLAT
jgi:hypothetical protein